MQIIGKLEEVHELVKRSDTFQVREFVLEVQSQNSQYSDYILFQLVNNRVALIDQFQVGQELVVEFDITGRKWINPEGKTVFFNRLNAWRINPYTPQVNMGGYQQQQMGQYQQPMGGYQQQQMGYQQQPMGGYQQQPMGGAQQQASPAQAQTGGNQGGSALNSGNSDDLPF